MHIEITAPDVLGFAKQLKITCAKLVQSLQVGYVKDL